jgi:hypothetical protein
MKPQSQSAKYFGLFLLCAMLGVAGVHSPLLGLCGFYFLWKA